MSKSGSRYGRRSNWFKIHCLLQEQQAAQASQQTQFVHKLPQRTPPLHQGMDLGFLGGHQFPNPLGGSGLGNPLLQLHKSKEELMLLRLDNYKHATSQSRRSPESHISDSSPDLSDVQRSFPLISGLLPPTFAPSPPVLFPPGYSPLYPALFQSVTNNNNLTWNHNHEAEAVSKRVFLDAILGSQKSLKVEAKTEIPTASPVQDDPMDLSMKTVSDRGSSPSGVSESDSSSDGEKKNKYRKVDSDSEEELDILKSHHRPVPLDLSTKL